MSTFRPPPRRTERQLVSIVFSGLRAYVLRPIGGGVSLVCVVFVLAGAPIISNAVCICLLAVVLKSSFALSPQVRIGYSRVVNDASGCSLTYDISVETIHMYVMIRPL